MSGRDIRAGAAYVELYLKNNRFARGLRSAEKQLQSLGAKFTAIGGRMAAAGAGITGTLFATVNTFAKMGDSLDKMSGRVGASVEFLSKLSYAAKIGGTDISAMEVGIRRMQRSAYDASRGLSTASDAFNALGINVKQSDGQLKSTEQLFMESAAALSRMKNNTQKAALATVIFGRAGTKLLPMLKDGKKGLLDMMQAANDMGIVMSTKEATAAAKFTDQMTRLKSILWTVAFKIGGAVADTFGRLVDRLAEAGKWAIQFVRNNQEIIKTVLKVGAVILGAGAALVAIGLAAQAAAFVVGGLASVMAGIGVVASAMAGIASAAFAAVTAVVSALLTPVGLVAAAVAGLAGWFVYASGTGGAAIQWLGGTFGELLDSAKQAFGGIADALKAGDLSLAAKILWLSIKVEWQKGVNALSEIWIGFKQSFMSTWASLSGGIAEMLINAIAVMKIGWQQFTTFMADKFSGAVETIKEMIVYVKALVTGLDASKEVAKVRKAYEQAKARRHGRRDQAIVDIERQRSGRIATLREDQKRQQTRIRDRYAAQLSDSKELEDLKRQRDAAIAEARKKAAASEPGGMTLEQWLKTHRGRDLGGPGPGEKAGKIAGTFSARAAGYLGGATSTDQEIAKATKGSHETLLKIERRMRMSDVGAFA